MSKLDELKPVWVRNVPKPMEPGILYISTEYEVSLHICPCGTCGQDVVLPFVRDTASRPHKWKYTEVDQKVTFEPSIGNYQHPCRSHYYIRENRVEWC